jgi:AraC family transcriptional regulator
VKKTKCFWGSKLGLFGKIEWHQRRPDAHHPFLVTQMSWSWFSAELVRIRPAELGYRKLTFVPIGSSAEGWNRFASRVSSIVAVHLTPTMSDYDANDISNVPPSLYFEDSNLKATLQKLQSVLDGSGLDDHAYAETLGLLLLWELKHLAGVKPSQLKPVRGGLTAAQLRRVSEFIDAKISTDITISDLAAVAELSQFHFIRAFKESVGQSPYQYILSERVRHAKELLAKCDVSIADIALAVGFHDASQLNRVFQKFVGVTPTAIRRQTALDCP